MNFRCRRSGLETWKSSSVESQQSTARSFFRKIETSVFASVQLRVINDESYHDTDSLMCLNGDNNEAVAHRAMAHLPSAEDPVTKVHDDVVFVELTDAESAAAASRTTVDVEEGEVQISSQCATVSPR